MPFKNRTIVRMLTISTSTFTAIDLIDATIRSAIESKGLQPKNPEFVRNFLLRVNFVGVGRCAVAIGFDVSMGAKRARMRRERFELMGEQMRLRGLKIEYQAAQTWQSLFDAFLELEAAAAKADRQYADASQRFVNTHGTVDESILGENTKSDFCQCTLRGFKRKSY